MEINLTVIIISLKIKIATLLILVRLPLKQITIVLIEGVHFHKQINFEASGETPVLLYYY